MPHQCVRCNHFYDDGAKEILYGCKCGGRLFFYVKQKELAKAKEIVHTLTKEEHEDMEKEIYDLIGTDELDHPVVLDFETVSTTKPGKYEIDVVKLFKNEPVIYKLSEGKYMIDLPEAVERIKKNNKSNKKK